MNRLIRRVLNALFVCTILLATGCHGNGEDPLVSSDNSSLTNSSLSSESGSELSSSSSEMPSNSSDAYNLESDPVSGSAVDTKTTSTKTTASQTDSDTPSTGGEIDYTAGSKPAKRATEINGFVRRQGKWLVDEAGEEWFIKGGGIDCGSLAGKLEPDETRCNESVYKAHAELGCNTIRLTFNWEIFFKSKTSNQFNDNGFEWLAQNVEWAKKYNMRLILNMHRIPCGDEATGNIHNPYIFWNESYQQKWLTVWREIARRFADEPVILGYSFWNEQNAPIGSSQEDAERLYGELYQKCIDVVRTVDTRHVIICEQIFGRQDQAGSYAATVFPSFPPLEEENLVYEYHCYEPMEFTYQDKSANQQMFGIQYGDPDIISNAGLYEYKNNESSGQKLDGQQLNSGWSELSSDVFTADSEAVAASPLLYFTGSTAADGLLEIQWVEIWDDTTGERVYRKEFTSANDIKSYFSYQANTRSYVSGALRFTNIQGSLMVQNDRVEIIRLTSGHRYRTVASVRGRGLSKDCGLTCGLRFWGSRYGKAYSINKEALELFHQPYVQYREEHNIPVFCGEWGAYYDCYTPGLNSEQWAEDMLTLMKEQDIYFTVHTPFAMYSKKMQPWLYTGSNPTFKDVEYTVLEDAFKRILPTI